MMLSFRKVAAFWVRGSKTDHDHDHDSQHRCCPKAIFPKGMRAICILHKLTGFVLSLYCQLGVIEIM